MAEDSDRERRADARSPIELKVEYKRLNTFFADYTKNISRGGTFIKTARPLPVGGPRPSMLRATGGAVALALTVIAVPAVIAAIRGIWTPTCDWSFGIETYLAMPVTTAVLAAATGHAIGVAVPRRFLGALAAQLPLIAVAMAALYRFYSEPPVFSYNAVLGYFPGNLYDENIRIRWPLAWSRLEDLAWVIALVAIVASWKSRRRAGLAIAAAAIAGIAILHHSAGALGYAPTAGDLEEVLDGRIETAHFIIHYAHSKDIDADIALIAEDHELRYAEVVAQLGMAPPGKLRSFYFADHDQKARWFGARDVEMAKPWRREIYLDHRPFPHGSLRHEIAHAVASAFGDPLFGVAAKHGVFANPGLIEGLAVAIDWPGSYDRPTPDEAVHAMSDLGVQPSIGRLLSLEFFSVSSARGYTTAGSFLRYLLDTHGAAKLRALYGSGGDFDGAYGMSLDQLEAGWRKRIDEISLPAGAAEAQRERFRGASVFARPCPHAIAASREAAARALAHGDRQEAIERVAGVCRESPDEPRYQLELADLYAAGTPIERARGIAMWATLAADSERVTSTLRVEVLERLAREAAGRGDRATLEAKIQEASALPIDSNERRQLDAEVFALAQRGPAANALDLYFFAPAALDTLELARAAVAAEPTLGFAHYLLGLQHTLKGDWNEAAAELSRAIELGLPGPPFVRNAARRLAIAAYHGHDTAGVTKAIATLHGAVMTTADRLLADDWQNRLDFDAGKPVKAP